MKRSGEGSTTHRLFFALWPTDEIRRQIASMAAPIVVASGGNAVPEQNFHITLAFVGSVAAGRVKDVCSAGAAVSASPFALTLDRIEAWARSHVLVLNSRNDAPPPLVTLVERLRISLLHQQIELPTELYRPHITLARKLPARSREAQDVSPLTWEAGDFALVESITHPEGSQYAVIDRWMLAADH